MDENSRKFLKPVENTVELWEKEILLVTSNFSFSHIVFSTLYGTYLSFWMHLKNVVCNLFQFEQV